jgi:hypothetical protein
MALPTFVAAGAMDAEGTGSSSAVYTRPAGLAAGDIILFHLYKENSETVTIPSGVTAVTGSPVGVTSGNVQWHYMWWKRATASEPSTYTFSWPTAEYRAGQCAAYRGCPSTGTPFDVLDSAAKTSSSTTTPAVAVTTTGPDRLLVWSGTSWNTGTWTAPTGFTLRGDSVGTVHAFATRNWPTAGATGNVIGTTDVSNTTTAWLAALLPSDGGGGVTPTIESFGKTTDGTGTTSSSTNKISVSTATPSSSGTLVTGHARVWVDGGSSNTRMVIYSDSAGSPATLLAVSDEVVVSATTEAVRDYTFSGAAQIAITSGTPYWIGLMWSDPGTASVVHSRDATAGMRWERSASAAPSWTYPNAPSTFGTPEGPFSGPSDFWVDYALPSAAEPGRRLVMAL